MIAFAALGGYVFGVLGSSPRMANVSVSQDYLKPEDFLSTNSGNSFDCAVSPPGGSYLALMNTGSAGSSVVDVNLEWAGSTISYTPTASPTDPCFIGASGTVSSTLFISFTSEQVTVSALSGQKYSGTVLFSNGEIASFAGTWL